MQRELECGVLLKVREERQRQREKAGEREVGRERETETGKDLPLEKNSGEWGRFLFEMVICSKIGGDSV